ncbi:hypothetical protein DMN91_009312 [Ooceraea biroi]|uniref:folate gamma-glutamyl hydrolase n=1 Tax=Ooceraea biroi TaxID=2015173 RepID=A0A3L8DEY1_OOCBI|nr:chitobiosyldiphosphodolichol beta-mannosyltransferase isoform X1 [Ooceraea biroi]RLU18954.1 hypothetical protein DMN91_009312 [Ooceraea biroi]
MFILLRYIDSILKLFWILASLWIFLRVVHKFCLKKFKSNKNVCVLVPNDIGRSPRMQYHAISFARVGFTVDVVGYPGSSPMKEVVESPRIQVHYLRPPPELRNRLPLFLRYVVKVIWQTVDLLWSLLFKRIPNTLIIQNPPAIPTIPVCWFYCVLMETQFIIDWHNYAYSLMSLGEDHILFKLAKHIEITFGRRATNNFCVTRAMKNDLIRWHIYSKVIYDEPADDFRPISLKEKNEFLCKLAEKYALSISDSLRRSGFIVSSTSWTKDEDFLLLFNALQEYENACDNEELNLPDLICVITGKGPLRDFYMAIVASKKWKHVQVRTLWLENEDYPKILATADLGICLHTSSSGLDLPMKIVNMFGCGLPVCAYNFYCLSELVRHNENGLVFASENELAQQLKMWFHDFPNNDAQQQLREKFQKNMFTSLVQRNAWCNAVTTGEELNDRPIIGILTQEIDYNLNKKYPDQYHSYIAASYVKFVEGAGARPVPIWIGANDSYYEDILSKINGVLWPGGATYFYPNEGYADAGAAIYRIAKTINKRGEHFPILGICLGFELLTYVAANRVEHRSNCSSQNQPLPLEFKPDFRKSNLFKNAPWDVVEILQEENVTANYHRYCVTEEDLHRVNLSDKFRVMSLNRDTKGLEFISTLEHKNYPFYGIQFHPEKNLYEWVTGKNIPHGRNAARISQYFANFFVNEARKNLRRFASKQEEERSLIYNYPITYTALQNSTYLQCYMFKKSDRNGLTMDNAV